MKWYILQICCGFNNKSDYSIFKMVLQITILTIIHMIPQFPNISSNGHSMTSLTSWSASSCAANGQISLFQHALDAAYILHTCVLDWNFRKHTQTYRNTNMVYITYWAMSNNITIQHMIWKTRFLIDC